MSIIESEEHCVVAYLISGMNEQLPRTATTAKESSKHEAALEWTH